MHSTLALNAIKMVRWQEGMTATTLLERPKTTAHAINLSILDKQGVCARICLVVLNEPGCLLQGDDWCIRVQWEASE